MSAKYSEFVPLPDTNKTPPSEPVAGRADAAKIIKVTIILRRQKSIDDALKKHIRLTREEFDLAFGIADEGFFIIEDFARHFSLIVESANKTMGTVLLSGKIGDFEKAFDVVLFNYKTGNSPLFRGRTGFIMLPAELINIVDGVFGLDDRPNTMPLSNLLHTQRIHKSINGYNPNEVAAAYGFPKDVTGKGECIGIIELGGGYKLEDMEQYFSSLKLPLPEIDSVGIDGSYNIPTFAESYDKEVTMNIQVAGAVAPGARIIVYFAPNNDMGFLNAITTAICDKKNCPSVISISWGAPESKWTIQSLKIYNEAFKIAALLGITICAATGNCGVKNGMANGGYHVDFPASSPYVLACGATTLLLKNNIIISETAWYESDSTGGGGGVSDFFSLPDYQAAANVPLSQNTSRFRGRGVPDVAGNANPSTGYKILVHGRYMLIGGTSSVAPLNAGLIALINQQKGYPAGFINPVLYENQHLCRNISERSFSSHYIPIYKERFGWDACTGLGVFYKL